MESVDGSPARLGSCRAKPRLEAWGRQMLKQLAYIAYNDQNLKISHCTHPLILDQFVSRWGLAPKAHTTARRPISPDIGCLPVDS